MKLSWLELVLLALVRRTGRKYQYETVADTQSLAARVYVIARLLGSDAADFMLATPAGRTLPQMQSEQFCKAFKELCGSLAILEEFPVGEDLSSIWVVNPKHEKRQKKDLPGIYRGFIAQHRRGRRLVLAAEAYLWQHSDAVAVAEVVRELERTVGGGINTLAEIIWGLNGHDKLETAEIEAAIRGHLEAQARLRQAESMKRVRDALATTSLAA